MKNRLKNPIVVLSTLIQEVIGVIGKLCLVGVVVAISACASPDTLESIYDPFEERNRSIHALNKQLDKAILRPASGVYAAVVPDAVGTGVSNFAKYFDIPGEVVNNMLQLDLEGAITNSARFVVNGTVGVLVCTMPLLKLDCILIPQILDKPFTSGASVKARLLNCRFLAHRTRAMR